MVSSNIMGGLGNYLFQIGAACTLAHKNNDIAIFDLSIELRAHRNIRDYITNILRNINISDMLLGYQYRFDEAKDYTYNEIGYANNLLLTGYYQSSKYLDREYILDLFSIDDVSLSYINDKYKFILGHPNTVSIHVRRGNYLDRQTRHPVQDIEYYNKAMSQFDETAHFVVFSNDIQWCKENFKQTNITFIDEAEEDYISLFLMSLCKHNIIANSSFSWWGSYLNKNVDKKVIAPSRWFGPDLPLKTENIYEDSWIII